VLRERPDIGALRIPSTRRWVRVCAGAETIGMTAASTAAVVANRLDTTTTSGKTLGLTIVVAGGVVEGVILGVLQVGALGRILDAAGRLRWAVATTVVAGLGWAAGRRRPHRRLCRATPPGRASHPGR
jgi:hypothetical protein